MLHRSRNSGREFAGWNQLPCGQVRTPNISCTKLKIHLAHTDSLIVPKYVLNLVQAIQVWNHSMLHRSKNSGREFAGWNQLPCGPVLTPNISCTKLKIHSAHTDSLIVPKHVLNLVQAIKIQDHSMLHKSRNSGREFAGWNQLPCGSVRTRNICCAKLKIHLAHGDSRTVPKHVLNFVQAIQIQDPSILHRSTNLGKNLQGGIMASSLVGQLLHPISLVQSSRSIQRR